MPKVEVKLKFVVDKGNLQEFVDRITEFAEQLRDEWQCPAVSGDDMRCELDRGHGIGGGGPKRHHHGTRSWPVAQSIV